MDGEVAAEGILIGLNPVLREFGAVQGGLPEQHQRLEGGVFAVCRKIGRDKRAAGQEAGSNLAKIVPSCDSVRDEMGNQ